MVCLLLPVAMRRLLALPDDTRFGQVVLQTRAAAEPVQMLRQPVHAVDRILVCAAESAAGRTAGPLDPLALRLLEVFLQAGEAALVVRNGLHKPLVARLLEPLFKEKRVCEQREKRGERVQGLGHVGLQGRGGGLRPDGIADQVRGRGAAEHDEGHLEKRLEAAFLDEALCELAGDEKPLATTYTTKRMMAVMLQAVPQVVSRT